MKDIACYQIEILTPQGTHSYLYKDSIPSEEFIKREYGLFARVGSVEPLAFVNKSDKSEVDVYHYQEAIHVTDLLRRMIETGLIEHWTARDMTEDQLEMLRLAQDYLGDYYRLLVEKQEELDSD